MKRNLAVWVFAGALMLTGCGNGDQTVQRETAPSSTTTPRATTTAVPASTTLDAPPPPPETTAAVPVTTDAPVEPVNEEPYIVECLEGTPGPARFSDGTLAFSQWCFVQLGGDEYLRQEREANTFECDGVTCRNPYTGNTYPDPDAVTRAPVGTTSDRGYSCYDSGRYWPDGTPVVGADRCGTRCGEEPTSGEIRTRNGCEAGYITDPTLCAGVGY